MNPPAAHALPKPTGSKKECTVCVVNKDKNFGFDEYIDT